MFLSLERTTANVFSQTNVYFYKNVFNGQILGKPEKLILQNIFAKIFFQEKIE